MNSRPEHNVVAGRPWRTMLCLVVLLLTPLLSRAQTQVEYFFDTDPGYGQALKATATPDADGNCLLALPATGVSAGYHVMGLRTRRVANEHVYYSPTLLRWVYISPSGEVAMVNMVEYFFDSDPGYGQGLQAPATPDANGNCQLALPATGVSAGYHVMGLRTRSVAGEHVNYSPTLLRWVYISPSGDAAMVNRAEYFFDSDPGYGNATPLTVTPAKELTLGNITHTATELTEGVHLLGIRVQAGDCWSPTILRNVVVAGKAISYAEYFWDSDPGYGKGTPITITPGTTVQIDNVDFAAPTDEGIHYLGIRTKAGNAWSPTIFYEYSSEDHAINDDDYAALQAFYNNFGGANWKDHPWNTSSNSIKSGKWGGVTFSADSRVMTINLEGRQISGTLSADNALNLPTLTGLNLSKNQLTGDAAAFLKHTSQLTSLNLSYNQLDELSEPLWVNATVDLSYQHRQYQANTTYPGLAGITGPELQIGSCMSTLSLPAIWGYSHSRQLLNTHPELQVLNPQNQQFGTLTWEESEGGYRFKYYGSHTVQVDDATAVTLQPTYKSDLKYSVWPASVHYTLGDANIDGIVDVLDVQRTLAYILGTDTYSTVPIALWPANTYSTGETTRVINIQDIVSTVNLVLQSESLTQARRRAGAADNGETARNRIYADGRSIMLDAQDEVAAIDLELDGVKPTQVKLMLSSRNWQMQTRQTDTGTRLVVFSPNGTALPAGVTTLLKLSADGQPTAATAASADALRLPIGVLGLSPTGIDMVTQTATIDATISDGRLVLLTSAPCGPTTVSVYGTQGMLLWQQQMDCLPSGETALPLPTTEKLLLVKVWSAETGMKIFKLHNEK